MPHAILLQSAEDDLTEIWDYIAEDSPDNATRLIRELRQTCHESLAHNPMIGRNREDLSRGLRSFPVGNYIIFYRPTDYGVEIVRVLHGRRNIEALF